MTERIDSCETSPADITVESLEEFLEADRAGVTVSVPRHVADQLAERSRKMSESHEPNRKQIYVLAHPDLPFPLRASPVRFAVWFKNGSASSLWKVKARDQGDVYIIPRDIMEGAKVSLHASGLQQIVLQRPSGRRMAWREPPLESPLQASVKLFFTVWSAGTGPTKDYGADQVQRMLEQNQVAIVGEDSDDTMISVCFFLTPPGVNVELPPWPPMATVAVLPVGADKELHIVARRERRPNLRAGLEARLNADIKSGAVSVRGPAGSQSLLMLAGDDVDGRPYVAPVSVETKEHGVELVRCRKWLVNVT